MTIGCQDTGWDAEGWRTLGGVTEDTDIEVGSDDEVRLGGAALVVTN